MANPAKIYTRLTRNAAGFGSYSSLWLAADHLMIVKSTGYTENYSRLQLSDLKAIFLTATDRRMWWSICWGLIAMPGFIGVVFTFTNKQTPLFSAIAALVGTVGLIWNTLLGPGCRAHVMTGVQLAELPALIRLKKARRVLAQLQPLVEQAQAHLVPAVPPLPPVSVPPAGMVVPPTIPVGLDVATDFSPVPDAGLRPIFPPADTTPPPPS